MSSTSSKSISGTGGSSGAPRSAVPRVAAGDRGATRIADRVVAKIAAQAAREVLDTTSGTPAHATVTVHHDIARVRVSLELDYPSDLAAQCAAVRRQVALRVEECASMSVPEVDIDIEHLHSTHTRTAHGRDRGLR
ncbi:Asp23/Gls24 family envelope stress response protein [Streptomyces sp. NRRL S-241]|uniref:Asp23/Gls24 family envelope stress response protein n=1 Tax=Streptomyces sp. NRRL S-241 TaxID=1463896 RepID=UPI00068C6258|nr:Asp23/Gls24 family envelope stress response protein [Streptomyces sp. NRRL S-241]